MSGAHVHLLLTHIPVVGILLGVEGLPGVSHAVIEQHEEAAVIALIAALILGGISLIGLWFSRTSLPRSASGAALVLAVIVAGKMAWTPNLGGQINHPEIRSDASIVTVDDDTGSHVTEGTEERKHEEERQSSSHSLNDARKYHGNNSN